MTIHQPRTLEPWELRARASLWAMIWELMKENAAQSAVAGKNETTATPT